MTEKRTIIIIYPQLKEKELIEVCCKKFGWALKYYKSVSDALPYSPNHF